MVGTFQFGGIASGLDTGQIIDSLMAIERRPLLALQSRQAELQARKSAFGDLSAKLTTLNDAVAKLLEATTTQARGATSSDATIATASASANTAVQSFTVNVTSLATRTLVTGASQIGTAVTGATSLAGSTFSIAPTSGTFTVAVGGVSKSFSVDAATDTVQSVLDKLNDATTGFGPGFAALSGNKITLSSGGSPLTLGSGADTSNFLTAMKLLAAPGASSGTVTSTGPIGVAQPSVSLSSANLAVNPGASGSFKVNGVQIDWNSTESLNSIITKINNSAANVTASYDSATDKFTLLAKTTGSTAIALEHVGGGDLLTSLGVLGTAQSLGKNAQYDLGDGVQRYSTSNTIGDAVSDVTLTLAGQGTTTIGLTQDTETSVTAVRDFVTAYNAAAGFIQQKTAFNATTNTGSMFTGSSLFRSVEREMRKVVSTMATGLTSAYTSLPQIGISTGAFTTEVAPTKNLVLDEAKLTQALEDDQQAVTDLLTSASGPVATLSTHLTTMLSDTGVLGSGDNSAMTIADDQIATIDKQIANMELRLDARQASLEKKFASLELTMARLQAQSAQIASQLQALSAMAAPTPGTGQ
ncbi:MAG: flagellar filament capping protein FliD [Chloroflexota bacterium]